MANFFELNSFRLAQIRILDLHLLHGKGTTYSTYTPKDTAYLLLLGSY